MKKSHVKWETRKSSPFLHLCKHGFNWEQLQLFTKLDSRYIDLLCEIESQSRGGHLCRSMIVTSRYIQEAETSFDPHVTLLTWEEWIEDYQDSCRRDQRWRAHESTVTLLNRRRDEREPLEAITMDHELFVGQPYYDYDLNTGARRKSD
ncbi:putative transmembrane protein [Chlamydia abortus]|nr:putative transmembrane protein [Chlamydia abortus]